MKTNDNNIAEVRLNYSSKVNASGRPQVLSSVDALKLFRESWDKETIELYEECKLNAVEQSK